MSDLLTPEKSVEEPRKGHRAPVVTADDDILDGEVVIPTPPPHSAGKIQVQLRYLGRGKPLPVEDPRSD
jgi:hypothetical protein